jgi:hypothetical protein
MIANLQPRGLAPVGNILRRHADGAEGKESVPSSNLRRPINRYVRQETTTLPQFDISSNHAVGTDLAGCRDFRSRIDDGCGMNRGEMNVHG